MGTADVLSGATALVRRGYCIGPNAVDAKGVAVRFPGRRPGACTARCCAPPAWMISGARPRPPSRRCLQC